MCRIWIVVFVVIIGYTMFHFVFEGSTYKKLLRLLTGFIYVVGVLYFTLLSRKPSGNNRINIVLFYSFFRSLKYPFSWNSLIHHLMSGQFDLVFTTTKPLETAFLNVLLFVPMGYILPTYIKPKNGMIGRVLMISAVFSLCIETVQIITRLGWFDIDDVFCNVVGSSIGLISYYFARQIKSRWRMGE